MLTDRAASPTAWPDENHGQACRSGECTVAAEAVMNNVGEERQKSLAVIFLTIPAEWDG
jgi:hypothetical protein